MSWLLLIGAIVSEAAATMALRASDGLRRRRWIPLVAAGYVVAFALLGQALAAGMALSVAYGIWAACGVALTALGARVLFGERLTPKMVVGIVLIAVGVLLVEIGGGH